MFQSWHVFSETQYSVDCCYSFSLVFPLSTLPFPIPIVEPVSAVQLHLSSGNDQTKPHNKSTYCQLLQPSSRHNSTHKKQRSTDNKHRPVVTVEIGHVHPVACDKSVAIQLNVNGRRMWDWVACKQKTQDSSVRKPQRVHGTVYYLQLVQPSTWYTVEIKTE